MFLNLKQFVLNLYLIKNKKTEKTYNLLKKSSISTIKKSL
jgi:hypothetical protein